MKFPCKLQNCLSTVHLWFSKNGLVINFLMVSLLILRSQRRCFCQHHIKQDGLTLIPWQRGKPLVWNATVITPLASSYVDRAATGAGVVYDLAADWKLDKYSSLSSAYTIQPIAVNNLGGFSTSTTSFLSELARRLSSVSNDPNETLNLFQRISVVLQRFNSVLLHDSFPDNTPDQ